MQAILISIKAKWRARILGGAKKVEIRKIVPKIQPPFKVYLYEALGKPLTSAKYTVSGSLREGVGMVVGEFLCDKIYPPAAFADFTKMARLAGMTTKELSDYLNGRAGYGLHIASVRFYETPLPLSAFYMPGKRPLKIPPQSFAHVEEVEI